MKKDEGFCKECGRINLKEELEAYDGICQECYNEKNGTHDGEE